MSEAAVDYPGLRPSDLGGERTLPGGFFDFSREGIQVGLRDKRQVGLRFRYSFL